MLLAPIAVPGLVHHEGERAAARAAQRAGSVFCLSSRATTDVAEPCDVVPDARPWLQLYVYPDRDWTRRVLERAARAGVERIVLTVDLPVGGRRPREDRHDDVPFPPAVTLAEHGARVDPGAPKPTPGTGWDPALDWAALEWVADASGLPVSVKGILSGADAALAVEHGADAVIVSDHGARQHRTSGPSTWCAGPEAVTVPVPRPRLRPVCGWGSVVVVSEGAADPGPAPACGRTVRAVARDDFPPRPSPRGDTPCYAALRESADDQPSSRRVHR